ncbi:MAG: twin-arginine translocase subunit TatC [Bacillus sp. (in: firmicutes)]
MSDKELNVVDHIGELRNRLIWTAVAFIGFFVFGWLFVEELYEWFVRDLDVKLLVLGPSEIIWVYVMLAGVMAIAGTIPFLALQIWLFIRPALKPSERKTSLYYIPALFLLFVGGLCFGYFIIFPTVLGFLIDLSGDMFVTNFTAEKYFKFLLNMTLPFAVLFELPVVTMFLTSLGLINPFMMAKMRRYAYFVLVVIAVLITPPDFISDLLVILPLLLLYEISINLSKIVYKRRQKRLEFDPDEYDGYEDIGKV